MTSEWVFEHGDKTQNIIFLQGGCEQHVRQLGEDEREDEKDDEKEDEKEGEKNDEKNVGRCDESGGRYRSGGMKKAGNGAFQP